MNSPLQKDRCAVCGVDNIPHYGNALRIQPTCTRCGSAPGDVDVYLHFYPAWLERLHPRAIMEHLIARVTGRR